MHVSCFFVCGSCVNSPSQVFGERVGFLCCLFVQRWCLAVIVTTAVLILNKCVLRKGSKYGTVKIGTPLLASLLILEDEHMPEARMRSLDKHYVAQKACFTHFTHIFH